MSNKIIQQKYEYANEVMTYERCSDEVKGLIRAFRYRPDDFVHIIEQNAFGKHMNKFTLIDKKHGFEMSFHFHFDMFETIIPIEYTDWMTDKEAVYVCTLYRREVIDVRNEKADYEKRLVEARKRSIYASENNN